MRGTVRRVCAAGLVVGVLVTGLTACAGDDTAPEVPKTGRAVVKACADGTFTWSRSRSGTG
ncbi:hypothetical protein [Streptomyces sp. NPDC050416]|uniref:hypothetical protein n=1 Tax=Streptomyces sp. NPDC050416 TaxID=3365611 RepID=UPI0037B3812F